MKRIWIGFVLLCCVFPAVAQESRPLTVANLKQEMALAFTRARQERTVTPASKRLQEQLYTGNLNQRADFNNLFLQKNFSARPELFTQTYHKAVSPASATSIPTAPQAADKHWQLVVLMAIDRPKVLERTNRYLRSQIKKGNAQQAVFVDFTKEDNARLHLLFHRENNEVAEQVWDIACDITPEDLFSTVFEHIRRDEASLYTGLLIHGHGSGTDIYYDDKEFKQHFSMQTLIQSIQATHVHIDVMELSSCHMGSFYSAYHLSKDGLVDFLTASANFGFDNDGQSIFQLVRFLNYAPQEAAIRSIKYMPGQFDFEGSWYDYMTELALDVRPLHDPLQAWLLQYIRLVTDSEELARQFESYLTDVSYSYSETEQDYSKTRSWRSLKRIVKQEKEYVQKHFNELTSDADYFIMNKAQFIRASEELLEALEKATLVQWCYVPGEDKIYRHQMPGKCLDGISVDKQQFDLLIKDVKESWRPIL